MTSPKPTKVRIGILGTSRVARYAVIAPARKNPLAEVVAVASRDTGRADRYANRYGINRVLPDYQSLINDDQIDVVYVPLPNSLHCEWARKSLDAGKHVLCEKPVASNEAEVIQLQAAARRNNRILAEAFHFRYHPMASRLRFLVQNGALGPIKRIRAQLCLCLPSRKDFRFSYELAGGAVMDVGCYAINLCRFLMSAEPVVKKATVRCAVPEVDDWATARLEFPGEIDGRITCSIRSVPWKWRATVQVTGEQGSVFAFNPFAPHLFNFVRLRSKFAQHTEVVKRGKTTYSRQLRALVAAINGDGDMPTSIDDALHNMRVIDAIYEAAGLKRRGLAAA